MNRRGRVRRQWTHRRLGLGAAVPADLAMARTEALLAAVGARRSSIGVAADGFETALFDYVYDADLTAGVADLDAMPIPIAALRAQAMTPPKRRITWRLLVPAMSGSLAALVIIVALLVGGSTAPQSSTLSAATESKQLLSHADLLLTAAQNATTTERAKLVTEAKADLTHVARLLPLAPPQEQPAIRTQLQRLDRRVPPFAPARTQSGGGGANHPSNTGASGATTPVRHRPPRQQQSGPGSGADQTSGAPTRTGATSGTGTARQPAPTGSTGTQQTGNQPPPPSDGGMQPRQPQTQSGPSYGGTTRPPPGQ